MKILSLDDLTFTIEPLEEHIPVQGNLVDSGNPAFDKYCEDKVIYELGKGNIWSWCVVRVTGSYLDILTAEDYLGGCSYDSEEAFIQGGYYDDMRNTCLEIIQSQLDILLEATKPIHLLKMD